MTRLVVSAHGRSRTGIDLSQRASCLDGRSRVGRARGYMCRCSTDSKVLLRNTGALDDRLRSFSLLDDGRADSDVALWLLPSAGCRAHTLWHCQCGQDSSHVDGCRDWRESNREIAGTILSTARRDEYHVRRNTESLGAQGSGTVLSCSSKAYIDTIRTGPMSDAAHTRNFGNGRTRDTVRQQASSFRSRTGTNIEVDDLGQLGRVQLRSNARTVDFVGVNA